MRILEFLKENRLDVVNFYNLEISKYFNITLADFMKDLLKNFKQITTGEELKKFDIFANLQSAKSRLGLFDNKIEVKFDRDTFIANKYKGTKFEQNLAL